MMKTFLIETENLNPYHNLAVESALANRVGSGEIILYLWQNQRTVVIGRHQNPWVECRTQELEQSGGHLARRTTGGGAVFHDLGNLNFTFIIDKNAYDLHRQTSVILAAVRSFGIDATFTGRNDLTVEDQKFSGNAYCFTENAGIHHGTLLVDVDFTALSHFLQVDADKIKSKGIASVRSRVTNLNQYCSGLTINALKSALISAFEQEYGNGVPSTLISESSLADVDELAKTFGSWKWLYGATPKFDTEFSNRFIWGGITISLSVHDGCIADCSIWSDAMDVSLIEALQKTLIHIPFRADDLYACIASLPYPEAAEVALWLKESVAERT